MCRCRLVVIMAEKRSAYTQNLIELANEDCMFPRTFNNENAVARAAVDMREHSGN